jgi:hypothetical protein
MSEKLRAGRKLDVDIDRAAVAESRSLRGALTSSLPSAYSTRVSSAAVTSSGLEALLGRICTLVSWRSSAVTRTSAARSSSTTEIGLCVSK